MTQRNWLGNTGAWSDPTQWDTGLPGTADTANFTASGTYSVDFATTASIIAITGGGSANTLNITLGMLTLNRNGANSNWNGAISQTGGTVVLQSGSLRAGGTVTQTGGTVSVGLGAHLQQTGGNATFGGELTGMGELDVGGTVTLSGIVGVAAISMGAGGVLQLGSNEAYAGAYIPASGSLLLNGHQIIFSGHDNFGNTRIVGPGTVAVEGSADLPATSMTGNGGTLVDAGTITDDGIFALGTGNTDRDNLIIAAGAVFDVLTDTPISSSNGGAVPSGNIINNGTFEKTAGAAGSSTNVQAPFTNNGVLNVALGTLLLSGPSGLLGGTIEGAGTLSIGTTTGAVILAAGVAVDVAAITIGSGATLALGGGGNAFSPTSDIIATGASSAIELQGNTLTVQAQGVLDSTIDGPGTLFVGGRYAADLVVTGGTVVLEDGGVITQSGPITLGTGMADAVTLHIDAGAVYDIVAAPGASTDDNMHSFSSGTTFAGNVVNDGLFVSTANGGGAVHVEAPFTNDPTGTIVVAKGSVAWTQGLVNNGSGTIDGMASITGGLTGTGSLTLEAGAHLAIAGPVSAGETITFAPGATGAELDIATPGMFAGTVNHFAAGETLEFPKSVFNEVVNAVFSWGLTEVFSGTSTAVGSLQVMSPPGTFFLTEDGAGGRKILGTNPGNFFPGGSVPPSPGMGTNTWTPADGATRSWFTAADWSTLGIPDEHQAVIVGEPVPFDLTFAGGGVGVPGTVDNLTGASTATLLLESGALAVLEGGDLGGTFAGAVTQTGGTFDSVSGYVFAGTTYAQSASGFLESDSGVLDFEGETASLAGTTFGSGILEISGGGTLTPVPGVAFNVHEILVTGGATLVPFADETFTDNVIFAGGNMPLFASSVTFTGTAALAATVAITTNGTIVVTGTADGSGLVMNGASGELLVQGEVTQTGGDINLNSTTDLLSISARGTYDIEADVNPFGGHIVNAGLFEKTGGGGTSHVEEPFASTGVVNADSGTLWLDSSSVELGGTVKGTGTLLTFTNGSPNVVTLDAGLFIGVGTFAAGSVVLEGDQTYDGAFSANGAMVSQGHTFTLGNQAELTGVLSGPGAIRATHSADLTNLTLQGVGATLSDEGVVTESGGLTLGNSTSDQVTLAVGAGHTFNDLVDASIVGTFGTAVTGTIANAGTFEKTAGGGSTAISAELINTGTVLAQHGTLTLNAAAINDGRIVVDGNLVLNATVSADSGKSGTIEMAPTATLTANAAIGANQTVEYDPGGLMAISQIGHFAASVVAFTPGDTIDLVATAANGASYANGVLTLTETIGSVVDPVGTIAMPGLANPAGITLANDGTGGTFIVEAPCFAEGTCIDTPCGSVAVEHLRIGDTVLNARGEEAKIEWLGHRRIECRHHPRPWDVRPVRIDAGAFAPGLPQRALRLSPDHAIYVGDTLIPLRYLINGASVVQEDVDEVVYWHVELPRHDVLLAEGLPAESYLDTGNRHAFNHGKRAAAAGALG